MAYFSAEEVRDEEGRQYHIGLAPGEVASNILLVGDPARAKRVAGLMEEVKIERSNREYLTFTGIWQGLEVSVMATGMGCDNMEIAIIELSQVVENPVFIRAGSCGGLQENMNLGELVISTGAVRMEDVSTYFVPSGYPALAHHEVILALIQATKDLGYHPFHVGLTATGASFYGAQGRTAAGWKPLNPGVTEVLQSIGVKNFEMESSTLFTLATLRGYRAGTICAIYANRPKNEFISPELKSKAELHCIETALKAFQILEKMDSQRKDFPYWLPFG
ncbi:MAG: uridine phosphorylase [Planctomycetota bacterium]|nr:MAG: uridine phosphorylase [Planctomycetota bacterium]